MYSFRRGLQDGTICFITDGAVVGETEGKLLKLMKPRLDEGNIFLEVLNANLENASRLQFTTELKKLSLE